MKGYQFVQTKIPLLSSHYMNSIFFPSIYYRYDTKSLLLFVLFFVVIVWQLLAILVDRVGECLMDGLGGHG